MATTQNPADTTRSPTTRIIFGFGLILFAVVLMGLGVHRVVEIGTCSSTGYNRYGPAPVCPKGLGWYVGFLSVGGMLLAAGCLVTLSAVGVGLLFVSIGLGAGAVGLSANPAVGKAFPLVFGGCFLLAGVVYTGVSLRWAARHRADAGEPSLSLRSVLAVAVWVVAAGAAAALGQVAAHASRTNPSHATAPLALTVSEITDGQPLPQPAGTPRVNATDPDSLFHAAKLTAALKTITAKFGANSNVVAATIYPGELEVVVDDSSGGGHLAVVPVSGRLQVSSAIPLPSTHAVYLSQLLPGTPSAAAAQLAADKEAGTGQLSAFVLNLSGTNADWRILAEGGRQFTTSITGGKVT